MEDVSEHVIELLELREKSEEDYRRQVMRLIGARRLDQGEPLPVAKRRRVEGTLHLRCASEDERIDGLVMFALGKEGCGARADIRSKDGMPSAKSLLFADEEAEFILVITADHPAEELLREAEAHSRTLIVCGRMHESIWVIGLPEIVARSLRLLELQRQEDEFWNTSWWRRLLSRKPHMASPPHSPLLLPEDFAS